MSEPIDSPIFGFGVTISADSVKFANVTNIPFPTIAMDEVETTHLESANGFREWIPGWKDGGEIELGLRFTENEYARILALVGVTKEFTIDFPSGGEATFSGFVKSVAPVKSLDDAMEMPVTIRTTGTVAFTAGTNSE